MTNAEKTYTIEKRVANTDVWGKVGNARTRKQAVEMAHVVVGGRSTGVRVTLCEQYATPEVIVGV